MEQNLLTALLEIFGVFVLPMGALIVMYIAMMTDPTINNKRIKKQMKKHSLFTQWILYSVRSSKVSKYKEIKRELKRQEILLKKQQEKVQGLHNKKATNSTNVNSQAKIITLSDLRLRKAK